MTVRTELEVVRNANGGILSAAAVVDYARNPETELHSKFCWDNTEAARLYRLQQAHYLIRLTVIRPPGSQRPLRLYVSLTQERGTGEYRNLEQVLSNRRLRQQLLRQGLRELEAHRQRFGHLAEFAEVYEAMQRLRDRVRRNRKPQKQRR